MREAERFLEGHRVRMFGLYLPLVTPKPVKQNPTTSGSSENERTRGKRGEKEKLALRIRIRRHCHEESRGRRSRKPKSLLDVMELREAKVPLSLNGGK